MCPPQDGALVENPILMVKMWKRVFERALVKTLAN